MTIYVAAPIFTLAERRYNVELATLVSSLLPETCTLVLPQNFAAEIGDKPEIFKLLFERCLGDIDNCTLVVALLDGADADSGTSVEVGYAYAKDKPILGVRTDFRALEEKGLNLMLSRACRHLILDSKISIQSLANAIAAEIRHIGGG